MSNKENEPNLGVFTGTVISDPVRDIAEIRKNKASEEEIDEYVLNLWRGSVACLKSEVNKGKNYE